MTKQQVLDSISVWYNGLYIELIIPKVFGSNVQVPHVTILYKNCEMFWDVPPQVEAMLNFAKGKLAEKLMEIDEEIVYFSFSRPDKFSEAHCYLLNFGMLDDIIKDVREAFPGLDEHPFPLAHAAFYQKWSVTIDQVILPS